MTIINPNSIAGITSVTAEAGVMNFYKSDGTLAGLQLNGVNFNTTSGISTFNNVYVGGTITYEDVKNVDSIGIVTARDHINIVTDNKKLQIGAGQDLTAYHDGTDSWINSTTGDLKIRSQGDDLLCYATDDIYLMPQGNDNGVWIKGGGGVTLYHNNGLKFETTSAGATLSGHLQLDGHLDMNDDHYIKLGTGDDLMIYHNGSSSFISDEGTGSLKITTNGTGVDIQKGSSETIARFIADGAVELYYNNVKRFETTSGGAMVSAPEGGDANLYFYADEGDDNADKWLIQSESDGFFALKNYASGSWETSIKATGNGAVELYNNNVKTFETTADGTITQGTIQVDGAEGGSAQIRLRADEGDDNNDMFRFVVEDGGNGLKIQGYDGSFQTRLTVDSSGRVLIGTTTEGNESADELTVASSGNTGITIRSGTSSNASLFFSDATSGADEYRGFVQYVQSDDVLKFGTATNEAMRIDSSGRVLIGGTSNSASSHADELQVINTSAEGGISIINGTSSTGHIYFGDTDAAAQGRIDYGHSGDYMRFYAANTERLRITSSEVQIKGDASRMLDLITTSGTGSCYLSFSDSGGQKGYIGYGSGGNEVYYIVQNENAQIQFYSNSYTRAFLNPDGKFNFDRYNGTAGLGRIEFGASGEQYIEGYDTGNAGSGSYLRFGDGGAEYLRINSNGQVSIGNNPTVASDAALHIELDGTREYLRLEGDAGTSNAYLEIEAPNNRRKAIIFKSGGTRRGVIGVGDSDEAANATSLFFSASSNIAGNSPHMVIDSSGRVLIGTTTEGYSSGDDLTIATTGHTGITIRSGTTHEGAVYFSDATSGGGEYIGSLVYSHNTNAMMFTTNGSERVRITGDSNTCTLKLYNQANADASATCEIQANHDIRDSSKIVFGRENANDWSASWASQHSNISFHTFNGSSNLTEKMHIKANGAAQFTTTGSYDTYTTAQNAYQFRHGFTNVAGVWISNTNTSHTKELLRLDSARGGSSSFYLFNLTTGNLSDDQFLFRADGNGYCDASWNGGGADYAEYFEWTDGNSSDEDRRGMTVVLDGNKVKPSTSSDSADDIIGVVSASPVVVGDGAHMQWTDKYLRDDYGAYDLDENGERKLNPSYDDTKTYVTREDRKEWDTIGMVGKLRIRKGQKTGTRWIKMRDISDSIEEWLVR